jgi:hypothetical protein
MADKFRSGPAFTMHVPVHPHATDPSQTVKAIGQPAPLRQTVTFSWVKRGLGHGLVARMNAPGGPVAATAAITVIQANCVPGEHLIRVGQYELRPGVDFAVGANDIALAANLAAAILALQGFSGVSDGIDTVTVTTTVAHSDEHRIEVVEWGAASAFALAATEKPGYMTQGDPSPYPPEFT